MCCRNGRNKEKRSNCVALALYVSYSLQSVYNWIKVHTFAILKCSARPCSNNTMRSGVTSNPCQNIKLVFRAHKECRQRMAMRSDLTIFTTVINLC